MCKYTYIPMTQHVLAQFDHTLSPHSFVCALTGAVSTILVNTPLPSPYPAGPRKTCTCVLIEGVTSFSGHYDGEVSFLNSPSTKETFNCCSNPIAVHYCEYSVDDIISKLLAWYV